MTDLEAMRQVIKEMREDMRAKKHHGEVEHPDLVRLHFIIESALVLIRRKKEVPGDGR